MMWMTTTNNNHRTTIIIKIWHQIVTTNINNQCHHQWNSTFLTITLTTITIIILLHPLPVEMVTMSEVLMAISIIVVPTTTNNTPHPESPSRCRKRTVPSSSPTALHPLKKWISEERGLPHVRNPCGYLNHQTVTTIEEAIIITWTAALVEVEVTFVTIWIPIVPHHPPPRQCRITITLLVSIHQSKMVMRTICPLLNTCTAVSIKNCNQLSVSPVIIMMVQWKSCKKKTKQGGLIPCT